MSYKAQNKDTLLLMNGQIVIEQVTDTLIGAVTMFDPSNNLKKLHYEFEDIYMVKFGSGVNKYYYTQDTLIGNYFNREEMLYYIYGQRDARKGFNAYGCLVGAGITGIASGGLGLFFAPIFPFTYMGLSGITKVRIRHSTISNPNYIDHDPYILGYEKVSRSKRRIQAIIGGSIGLAAGYAIYFTVLKDKLPSAITLRF